MIHKLIVCFSVHCHTTGFLCTTDLTLKGNSYIVMWAGQMIPPTSSSCIWIESRVLYCLLCAALRMKYHRFSVWSRACAILHVCYSLIVWILKSYDDSSLSTSHTSMQSIWLHDIGNQPCECKCWNTAGQKSWMHILVIIRTLVKRLSKNDDSASHNVDRCQNSPHRKKSPNRSDKL